MPNHLSLSLFCICILLFFLFFLTSLMASRRVVVFSSSAELGPVLAHLVASRAEKAISSNGRFTLGLSGGSLVTLLSKELLGLPQLDCSKWVVGFCDERLVPSDDPESTYGLYKVCISEHLLTSLTTMLWDWAIWQELISR